MNFSSIKIEDGSSTFSLGKRDAESFENTNFKEQSVEKRLSKQSTMTDSTNTKKCKIPLKKYKTTEEKKKDSSKYKKRRVKVEPSEPYTFEKIQASPAQFYSRFEELLNYNSNLNKGLTNDVDGLERNLTKLQNMSNGKSNKDSNSPWLNSLNPIKKINMGNTINFDSIAKKITEQQSCKYSANFSNMDTTASYINHKRKEYPFGDVQCYPAGLSFNGFGKKHQTQKVDRIKESKRNILEDISSFDESIERDVDALSNASEDEKNYYTLKNMLSDMKDFIGDYSRNSTANFSDDCDKDSVSMFYNKNTYDDINDDDISMKGFKPIFSGIDHSDLLAGVGGQRYDNVQFF